jgi:hypothetical protein
MANYENAAQEEAPLAAENTGLGVLQAWPMNVNVKGASKSGGLDATKANPNYLMDKQTENTVLQNMQNLANKINNPMRTFNEGMKDVQAWTQYNKSPAFEQREAAAANDRRALYDIAQQQASIQASQQQAAATRDRINAMRGIGPGASGAPGSTTGAGAQGSRLPSFVNEGLDLMDPYAVGNQQALIDHYAKENINRSVALRNDPNAFKYDVSVTVPELGNREVDLNTMEARDYYDNKKLPSRFDSLLQNKVPSVPGMKAEIAASGPNADAARAAQRESSNNPNIGYHDLAKGTAYGTYGITDAAYKDVQNVIPEFKGRPITSLKPDEQTQAFNTYRKLTTDRFGQLQVPPTKQNLDLGHFLGPDGAARFLRDGTVSPEAAAANGGEAKAKQIASNILIGNQVFTSGARSGATTNQNIPGLIENPLGKKDQEYNRKLTEDFNKANLEVGKHRAVTAGTEAGKSYAKMQELVETADSLSIPTAEAVLEIAKDPKRSHVLAYLHGGDKVATALHTIDKRLNPNKTPAELEEQYISNKFGQQALEDYRIVKNASDKLGIAYAADVFKGARMGIGLEKMAQNAKGIGTDLPAAVNAKNAQLIIDAANFQKDKSKMYDTWAKSHGGAMADFHEFESTPEYLKFRDDAKNNFIQTYKGLVKPDTGTSGSSKAQQELDKRKKGN